MEIKIKLDGVLWGVIASFILAILKWCGKINWSWIWILCPFWGMCTLAIILVFIVWFWVRRKI